MNSTISVQELFPTGCFVSHLIRTRELHFPGWQNWPPFFGILVRPLNQRLFPLSIVMGESFRQLAVVNKEATQYAYKLSLVPCPFGLCA